MRITDRQGPGSVNGPATSARTPAPAARFSLGDVAGPNRAASTQATAPMGAMDGLLAVQAAGDQVERRRRAMRRGQGILDSLDRLKMGLLEGQVRASDLNALRQQLKQQREMADDAGLDDILAHVDLRAEVELAKLARR